MAERYQVERGSVLHRKVVYKQGDLMPADFTERDKARNVFSRRLIKVDVPDEPSQIPTDKELAELGITKITDTTFGFAPEGEEVYVDVSEFSKNKPTPVIQAPPKTQTAVGSQPQSGSKPTTGATKTVGTVPVKTTVKS
jgi:hypothetical protein